MKPIIAYAISASVLLFSSFANAESLDLADKFYEHGLTDDAKRELIKVVTDENSTDQEKSKSLSLLGDIAFDERKITLALKTWQNVIESFPESEEAKHVLQRIEQISQMVDVTTGDTLDNAIAQLYIRHGDWWSRGKEETITIDTSWIPKDKVAISWYDRVIQEFPNTDASILALKKKFYTIYGWEEPGKYGNTYGVRGATSVSELVKVHEEIEKAAPNDPDLQRFRYMVAQSYWDKRGFAETREWLQRIINAEDGVGGFYKDLAEWRMKKVEY